MNSSQYSKMYSLFLNKCAAEERKVATSVRVESPRLMSNKNMKRSPSKSPSRSKGLQRSKSKKPKINELCKEEKILEGTNFGVILEEKIAPNKLSKKTNPPSKIILATL